MEMAAITVCTTLNPIEWSRTQMARRAIAHTAVVSPASGITARDLVPGITNSAANAKNTTANAIVSGPPMLRIAVIHT